jgi:GT2 family glycosyltransferase
MMPRRWSDRIGLLDEIYSPVQYEDLDYCYRARDMGGEVWACRVWKCFTSSTPQPAKSDDINFKYVTTKNGVTFKRRWSNVFQSEEWPHGRRVGVENAHRLDIQDVNWRCAVAAMMPVEYSLGNGSCSLDR